MLVITWEDCHFAIATLAMIDGYASQAVCLVSKVSRYLSILCLWGQNILRLHVTSPSSSAHRMSICSDNVFTACVPGF